MWNSNENKIRVILIRHGKTPGNELKRYIGITDEGLSKSGIIELENKVKNNHYPKADIIFSSPRKRCIESAKIIYGDREVLIDEGLAEINFGEFEGKNYLELSDNENYQKWIESNGTMAFPNGDDRGVYIKRVGNAFERIIEENGKKYNSLAMVVHGGTIMAITTKLFNAEFYDYCIKNGEYLEIERDEEKNWRIIC